MTVPTESAVKAHKDAVDNAARLAKHVCDQIEFVKEQKIFEQHTCKERAVIAQSLWRPLKLYISTIKKQVRHAKNYPEKKEETISLLTSLHENSALLADVWAEAIAAANEILTAHIEVGLAQPADTTPLPPRKTEP